MIRNRWEAYACGPRWRRERPSVFAYRFRLACFRRGIDGEILILYRGREGKVLWLCLRLRYFLLARSDEMFAADSWAV